MITTLLAVQIRADRLEGAPAAIAAILTQTRARPGCLGVEVVQDLEDPAHLVIIEKWQSIEDDLAYRAWRATPEGATNLAELLAAPPSLTKFSARDDI